MNSDGVTNYSAASGLPKLEVAGKNERELFGLMCSHGETSAGDVDATVTVNGPPPPALFLVLSSIARNGLAFESVPAKMCQNPTSERRSG